MMKKIVCLFVLAGTICSISAFKPRPGQKPVLRTIIIDPGHGGFDPGTEGLMSKEKNVALAISLKLGKAIEEQFPDIKLVYTRTTDIMPGNMPTKGQGLRYRAELANKSKGDLFICIHANNDGHTPGTYAVKRVVGHKMVGKGKRRRRVPVYETYYVKNTRVGTGTYIWKADRNVYKGIAIGERESSDVEGGGLTDSTEPQAFDMNSPEAKIKAQLYEKKYFANSALFATLVEDEFVKSGRHSDGVMQRDEGIQVLQATGMPSVLIETGFLSNKEEELYLNSEEGQDEIVAGIIRALKRYKDTLEGHAPTGDGGSNGNGSSGKTKTTIQAKTAALAAEIKRKPAVTKAKAILKRNWANRNIAQVR